MSADMLQVIAPSENQITLIYVMCRERGFPRPDAIASVQEFRAMFDALKEGTYDPDDYVYPFGWERDLPF
jgi:hypothetical protein